MCVFLRHSPRVVESCPTQLPVFSVLSTVVPSSETPVPTTASPTASAATVRGRRVPSSLTPSCAPHPPPEVPSLLQAALKRVWIHQLLRRFVCKRPYFCSNSDDGLRGYRGVHVFFFFFHSVSNASFGWQAAYCVKKFPLSHCVCFTGNLFGRTM